MDNQPADINQIKEHFKAWVKELVDEQLALGEATLAPKWNGGKIVLHPQGDLQPKEIPMDVFFKKIVSVRDNLRVLEQKLNTMSKLSSEEKINLQSYITKSYGSLTSFNILFKDGKDRFIGAGSAKSNATKTTKNSNESLSIGEAKKKLGLNEY